VSAAVCEKAKVLPARRQIQTRSMPALHAMIFQMIYALIATRRLQKIKETAN